MHSRHVGTHIQKKPRGHDYGPINPQRQKRTLVATSPLLGGIQDAWMHSDLPKEQLQIRRIRTGFGLYHRQPIVKKGNTK